MSYTYIFETLASSYKQIIIVLNTMIRITFITLKTKAFFESMHFPYPMWRLSVMDIK